MCDMKSIDEGNKAFQCQDYETAISKFTICLSIASDPIELSILLNNRSSAYVELKQYENAVHDAKECVRLRPKWSDGYLSWGKALEANGDFGTLCNVYVNAIKRGEGHEKVLLESLITANEKYKIFNNDFMDVLLLGNSKYCEMCKKHCKLLRCSRCRVVYYCSQEHQKENWSKHKQQCGILAEAHRYLLKEKELKISKDLPWLILKQQFPSLDCVTDWDKVWEHLQCGACSSDIFQGRMSESMSWSLTLIKSICKFNLTKKERLIVHILGADDTYHKEGYFTYFPGFFPFPNMELILIGPDLLHNTSILEYKNVCGNTISISYITDVWHNFTRQSNYKPPDLILASHPGIHEDIYEWEPTIRFLISNDIPSVYTTWHKEDFQETICVLNDEKYNADILFSGIAPFPSLVTRYARKRWNQYGFQKMNSYWVGFKGVVS